MASIGTTTKYITDFFLDASMIHTARTFPVPTNLWIGFTTTTITDLYDGTTGEPQATWTSYARFLLSSAQFELASAGVVRVKRNILELVIDSAAVITGSTLLEDWFIIDNGTTAGSGNVHWFGELNEGGNVEVLDTNPVKVAVNALQLSLSVTKVTVP